MAARRRLTPNAFGAKGAEKGAVFDRYRCVGEVGRSAAPGSPGVGPGREPRWWEDTAMRMKHQWWSGLAAAVLGGLVGVTLAGAAGVQFLPILGVREGAQRSGQIPTANGFIDYLTLLNVRDGGIN